MALHHLWPRNDDFRRRTRLISQAARWQRISEYALFRDAYQRWHGSAPGDVELERIFVRFLYSSELPRWVEEYAQMVMEQAWREDPSLIPFSKRVFSWPNVLRCVATGWWLRHNPDPHDALFA